MRVLTDAQGTPEWERARKGRITASSISHVLAGKGTKSRYEYMYQLVLDLENVVDFKDTSPWFIDGRMYEAHARGWYNWNRQQCTEIGFVLHDEYNWLGASPDGLVGDDGCIEIKYRKSLRTFHAAVTGRIPRMYDYQMQCTMWVCNRQWCDYVNYWRDDGVGKEQGHVRRIERDEAKIKELEAAMFVFWADTLKMYRERTGNEHFTFPYDTKE